jgi:hypothetical protein
VNVWIKYPPLKVIVPPVAFGAAVTKVPEDVNV